ncbi:MAG TPA: AI-2E family transporter [Mucilaginibacter sp.]
MQKVNPTYLSKISQILFIVIAGTAILYFGKQLLVPLVFALVLAMLLIPLSSRMEKAGMSRSLATVICILILLSIFAVIIYLLSWQLANVIHDLPHMKERFLEITAQLQSYIASHIGIDADQQTEMIKNAGAGNTVDLLTNSTGGILGIFLNIILVLVYIFLMMCFRKHLMQFIIKAVPETQKKNIANLIHEAGHVSQQYLVGLALMIIMLWVMYGIGFSIIGVKYAIFFALLCGTLEMVPFIGNITGTTLTVLMGVIQGGDVKLIIGILITYGLVQFIQSYILQPLIVGKGVNLNPFFTIVSIIIGDAVWDVPGMILAIPLFGMIKIFCDHFESLKPYGFLLGDDEKTKRPSGFIEKIKKIFS